MSETERLFDEDSTMTRFTAAVVSCEEDGKLYKVVLDRTAFFPEEGGQSCDRGTLGGIPVEQVREKDRVVFHWLKTPLEPGTQVEGQIDWKKRFWDMQQHSGEHIVSGLMHSHFGFDNVGFHLGSEFVTMDFNGMITQEQLEQIEDLANEAVFRDISIKVLYPTREELASLDYRSKKEIDGQVRIVEVPGYDICACCAPHVHTTGEIGLIKLTHMEKYKGGIRVYMLCGYRALADYRQKEKSVGEISALLSAKPEEVYPAAKKLHEDYEALRLSMGQLKTDIVNAHIDIIPQEQPNVCLFDEHLDKGNNRRAWTHMKERFPGLCGSFAGDDESGYQFLLGGRECDAQKWGRAFTAQFEAKGGGSKEMFQGRVRAARTDIESWFDGLPADVND